VKESRTAATSIFQDHDRPRLITLRAGMRTDSRKTCRRASIFCGGGFRRCSKANRFSGKRAALWSGSTAREKDLMDDFTRRIARDQFALGHMQVGAVHCLRFSPCSRGRCAHRGHFQDGARRETRFTGCGRDRTEVRTVPAGIYGVYRKTLTLSRELASELSYLEQEAASVLVAA